MLLQTPKFGERARIHRHVNKFFYYAFANYPKIGKNAAERNSNAAQQKGCSMEYFIYCILEAFNPDSDIEFDIEKCGSQWAFGRDGQPDDGYDIKLDGMTIDVKADAAVLKGYVCLEVKTRTGLDSLLLKDVDYSIHAAFREKNLPSLIQINKGADIVFVDLKDIRQRLTKTETGYSIGEFKSRRTVVGTEVIDLPVSYLQRNKLADTYKF